MKVTLKQLENQMFKNGSKWILGVLLICITLSGCINTQKMMSAINSPYYKYKFSMRESNTRKKAIWQDKGVRFEFIPDYNRIYFTVENKSSAPVEILWGKTGLVKGSDSSAVIHQGASLSSDPKNQTPSVILEGATYKDFILPLLLIDVNSNTMSIRDLYPEKDDSLSIKTDWIMHQIGQVLFRLTLVVKIRGEEKSIPLNFYPIEIMRGPKSFKQTKK